MSLQEKIAADMKEAMKARDGTTLSVLRMLSAAMQGKQIEKRAKTGDQAIELTDEEVMLVIRHEAKKRQDSAEQFSAAGRSELAEKEKNELRVLQTYMPKELDDDALGRIVEKVIKNFGPVSEKDFGRLMGAVMKETRGQASGERVQAIVKGIIQST